jgi:hypothetical protein
MLILLLFLNVCAPFSLIFAINQNDYKVDNLNIKMYLRGSLVHCFERACPTAANCSDTKDSFYVQQITYLLTFINNV